VIALHGILAPVVTPFDGRGDVDLDGFASNVRAHVSVRAAR
jgi:dihydrodipicolinate synthase/N-acetylneuraminate lyase